MVSSRPKLPPIQERKVEAKCCLIKTGESAFTLIDEATALQKYPPEQRYYFMDGISWGNLLKVSAERKGRIHEYEQFPCVE